MDSHFTARAASTVLAAALAFGGGAASAITIDFDLSRDTSNFFSNATALANLNAAADVFEAALVDSLDPVSNFTAGILRPDNGTTEFIPNYSVAADTVNIFVGGQSLTGSTIAQGGPGTPDNFSRGQSGAVSGPAATDFAPAVGFISFDSGTSWYFDSDTSTDESFAGFDFFSVALHEIAHVLGFGTADSWDNLALTGEFLGTESTSLYGGAVPLQSGEAHWAEGIGSGGQETALDPTIGQGQRKRMTALDFAALDDIGWELAANTGGGGGGTVPAPAAWLLIASGLWLARRRQISGK